MALTRVKGSVDNIFDTVADMKGADLPAGSYVETKGYHTAGDGGGAKYLIQTAVEFGGTPDGVRDIPIAGGTLVAVLLTYGLPINVATLGVTVDPFVDIPTTITKSDEILTAITAALTNYTNEVFEIPSGMFFDGETLFDGIPTGSSIIGDFLDNGYSYTGYNSKGSVFAGADTQDVDSRALIQSGHHATLSLFNSQLSNTGIGGVGQSESSEEGKCTISFQAGYQTVNGRRVPNPSSRLQRYQTGGVGDIHFGLFHPTETGVGTRALFDLTSSGNLSVGGDSVKDEYNFLLYPDNTNTPANDKRTTLALRNVQPSGNGCKMEFVSRDAVETASMAINYSPGVLTVVPDNSLQGGYSGKLEEILLSADVTLGAGRLTPASSAANLKPVASTNKGVLNAVNTLSTGLTSTLLFVDASSTSTGFFFQKMRNHTNSDVFTVNGVGDVTANSYTPFTGCHFFYSESELTVGYPVDLVKYNEQEHNIDEDTVIKTNGKVGYTNSAMSKICVGLVHSCHKMESGGYLIQVAAIGDNISGDLKGFKVNSEGGQVEAGDILCTSSTVGELMKLPEGAPESIVRFKALSNPVDDVVYGYF